MKYLSIEGLTTLWGDIKAWVIAQLLTKQDKLTAGDNVTITTVDTTNTIDVNIPQTTQTDFGGIKAKERTDETNEVVIDSATGIAYTKAGAGEYTLPTATNVILGGVRAGAKTDEAIPVVIDGTTGNLFVEDMTYTLPTATDTVKGGVVIGDGLTMTGDVLSLGNIDFDNLELSTGYTINSIPNNFPDGIVAFVDNDTEVESDYTVYTFINNDSKKNSYQLVFSDNIIYYRTSATDGSLWNAPIALPVASDLDAKQDVLTAGTGISIDDTTDTISVDTATIATKSDLTTKADLVGGVIPANQLPSFVDDVIEVDTFTNLPAVGESGKVYVTTDTNITYRWGGTEYVPIGSDLALGETESTAYRGDRGKIAYDHSQIIDGNPHNTTADMVGLGNVDNTSDADKPISTATQTAIDNINTAISNIDFTNLELSTGYTPASIPNDFPEGMTIFQLSGGDEGVIVVTSINNTYKKSSYQNIIEANTEGRVIGYRFSNEDGTEWDSVITNLATFDDLNKKQDVLTAGTGITIDNTTDTISATNDVLNAKPDNFISPDTLPIDIPNGEYIFKSDDPKWAELAMGIDPSTITPTQSINSYIKSIKVDTRIIQSANIINMIDTADPDNNFYFNHPSEMPEFDGMIIYERIANYNETTSTYEWSDFKSSGSGFDLLKFKTPTVNILPSMNIGNMGVEEYGKFIIKREDLEADTQTAWDNFINGVDVGATNFSVMTIETVRYSDRGNYGYQIINVADFAYITGVPNTGYSYIRYQWDGGWTEPALMFTEQNLMPITDAEIDAIIV